VAYFQAGDLSQGQVLRRMGMRALRRPKRTGVCKIPVDYPDTSKPPVVEDRTLEAVTPGECLREWHKVQRGRDRFRLSCHPTGSLTVATMSSTLRDWTREGWVPDVVVIDYADVLAPPPGVREKRDQINGNWEHMRRLSQELHCLLVTATQADAASYDLELLRRGNFSEDRRKHDHVTAMLGLNATDADKKVGVTRLNWLDRRDEKFIVGRQVYVAGCLDIVCPAMKSRM